MSVPPIAMPVPARVRVEPGRSDQAARLRSLAEGAPRSIEVRGEWGESVAEVDRAEWPRIISIGSGKGGVGKTAIAVNLAIALARRGLRVTMVDGDLGTANIDVVCGISPTRRLDAAIRDRSGRTGAAMLSELSIPTRFGFRLVPGAAATARAADLSGSACRDLAGCLGSLRNEADLVIVDAGAGIGVGVRAWMHVADLPLVIATPEPAAIADAYGLMKCLRIEDLRTSAQTSLVLNQVGGQTEVDRVVERLGAVTRRFLRTELRLAGFVSWDRDVILASRTRQPLLDIRGKSRARRDIGALAGSVLERLGAAGLGRASPVR